MADPMIDRVSQALRNGCWLVAWLMPANFWRGLAKKAIAAMREPSDALCRAVIIPGNQIIKDEWQQRAHAQWYWRAMIDEVLRDA